MTPISAICVTYGRVQWLQETMAAFLAQDHTDSELIILNTCPQQYFRVADPLRSRIRIINLRHRPKSLGAARNMAISAATHEIIVILDDDDIALKDHLSSYATAFSEVQLGCDWVLLDEQFYMEGDEIKSITPGAQHMFAFTKKAWSDVGGYPELTCGEDRVLIGKITSKFQGRSVHRPVPTFIYRWGQGTYHASGMGNDQPGLTPVADRIAEDLRKRIQARLEPVGEIELVPGFKIDYERIASDYMAHLGQPKPESTCIVELGRYGDIVNVLPIAYDLHRKGNTPYMMVAWAFKDLLKGVSYVHPHPVRLSFDEVNEALKIAYAKYQHVLRCQIWGKQYSQDKRCATFNMESWRMAGYISRFHDPGVPLVFDNRNLEREADLCLRTFMTEKPKIVTNLTAGWSAPFPEGEAILQDLITALPSWEIVDVGRMVLPYPFDLLGIMDKADLIVSIDTMTLHLAQGCKAPLVCMVRDGWEGATPRFNCARKFTYSEARKNPKAVVHEVAAQVYKQHAPIT